MNDQDKLSTLLDNLKLCDARSSRDAEQRSIMLSEIAKHLCRVSQDEDISEIIARFCELTDSTNVSDGIAICSALVSETRLLDALRYTVSVGHEESTPAGSHGKVAFTKNKYNEIAFEQLSKKIIGAKAHYTASLSDASASPPSVSSGNSTMVMHPLSVVSRSSSTMLSAIHSDKIFFIEQVPCLIWSVLIISTKSDFVKHFFGLSIRYMPRFRCRFLGQTARDWNSSMRHRWDLR